MSYLSAMDGQGLTVLGLIIFLLTAMHYFFTLLELSPFYYIQVNWPGRVEGPKRYDLNPWSGKVQDTYWLRFPP